ALRDLRELIRGGRASHRTCGNLAKPRCLAAKATVGRRYGADEARHRRSTRRWSGDNDCPHPVDMSKKRGQRLPAPYRRVEEPGTTTARTLSTCRRGGDNDCPHPIDVSKNLGQRLSAPHRRSRNAFAPTERDPLA